MFILVVLLYLVKKCWPKGIIQKDQTSCELDIRYHQDLIDMDGLIVPVGRPTPRTSHRPTLLPAPPSYSESFDLPAESTAQDITPQYSYSNR